MPKPEHDKMEFAARESMYNRSNRDYAKAKRYKSGKNDGGYFNERGICVQDQL
jgi:hypothetical protein